MVQVARALADPTRYRMLQEIRAAGEMTCSQLQSRLPLSQATVSHHIKTLARAGLVHVRVDGLFHHVSADPARLAAFADGVVAELALVPSAPERAAKATKGPRRKSAASARRTR